MKFTQYFLPTLKDSPSEAEIISHKQLNYFSISEIWDTLLRENKLYGYEHKGEFKHLTDYEIYEKLFI